MTEPLPHDETLDVIPVTTGITPVEALSRLRHHRWPVLLESARLDTERGRYSVLAVDPLKTWILDEATYGINPFAEIRTEHALWNRSAPPCSLPFVSGMLGLLGYELGHAWEKLPTVPKDAFYTPALAVGLYRGAVCWDHSTGQTWLIRDRRLDSIATADDQRDWDDFVQALTSPEVALSETSDEFFVERQIADDEIRGGFEESVRRVIDYIGAGDIYQANLSRKIPFHYSGDALSLYQQIRHMNPAPYSGFFQPDEDWAVISASPEQFLTVNGREVRTRPIKGTRPRWPAQDLDLLQGAALEASEKDRAENTMIVDLLRNDLSRVCQSGSINVPQWCHLETFEKVHHLVSEVAGVLRDGTTIWDLLAATFPGGSITGAPKIRAMEIISELEGATRGCYCGSLFAADFSGQLRSSILIRTLTWKPGQSQVAVGGGIVADSYPAAEYFETRHKAAGLIPANYTEKVN